MASFLFQNALRWMIMCVAIFIAAQIPVLGITYNGASDLFLAGFILVVVNTFVRPVLMVLSLPLIIFSLGFALLVINAFLLLFVSWLLPGFEVAGFWSALAGALVISVISIFLGGHWRWKKKIGIGQPPARGPRNTPVGYGEVIDI